ncbi:hypothetical protein [Paenibacillus sanguinis]|uniref:hypothetical protein n=1 Tax=Paenibacillus sanguinis TaxID=225906 RepID=UPI001F0B42E7|nr:hypothetical protein [Paenibacillus sanguinis]
MKILTQKMLWLGLVLVLIVLTIFGVAMMGSVLGSRPKELPVALVILDRPADLSSSLLSLATPSPIHPDVKIITNEGMNNQASLVVRQGMRQAMQMINEKLLQLLLEQIGQQTEQIPVETAKALMSPVNVQEEVAHSPGANNASGNAPGFFDPDHVDRQHGDRDRIVPG